MSKNAYSYSKYLSGKNCCNYLSNVTCVGTQGPTGAPGIGIQGNTGATGESITGPTGPSSSITGPTGAKSFIIDHPLYPNDKYLIHMCLEGPEAGVYYRGKGVVLEKECVIELPNYVDELATDFTVYITGIYTGSGINTYSSSLVKDGKFTVYSNKNGEFNWCVYGKRKDCIFNVEPRKSDVNVYGSGPYLYHTPV
jgi:hypothetical protein